MRMTRAEKKTHANIGTCLHFGYEARAWLLRVFHVCINAVNTQKTDLLKLCNKSYLGWLTTNCDWAAFFLQSIVVLYLLLLLLVSYVSTIVGALDKGINIEKKIRTKRKKGTANQRFDVGYVRIHIICGEKRWNQWNNLYCGLVCSLAFSAHGMEKWSELHWIGG